jgi:hypothetical protein
VESFELSTPHPRPRRRYGRIAAAAIVLLLLIVTPLVVAPPAPVTSRLVLLTGDWILSGSLGADAGRLPRLRYASRKIVASYLEHSLLAAYAREHPVEERGSDVERIVQALVPLRTLLVTQLEVPHVPTGWQSFISGVGYCDQVNGVAAHLLASSFPVAESFALFKEGYGSPHTVGRVWSSEVNDWLYFDIFWGGTVVFRFRPGEGVQLLARVEVAASRRGAPLSNADLRDQYQYVERGVSLNRYRSTFVGYLGQKVVQAVQLRSLYATSVRSPVAPGLAPEDASLSLATLPGAVPLSGDPADRSAFNREYLRARMEQVLDRPAEARVRFQRLSLAPRMGGELDILREAAGVFVAQ